MCGRYAVVTKVKVIEERFGVKVKKPKEPKAEVAFEPHANIGVGMFAPVITQAEPHELQAMQFGLTPSWAKKPMYLFNARMEGDHNKEDSPDYRGAKGIIEKPSFRKAIRSQRCLVVADAFLEGSKEKGLSEPFLVYMRKKERPFAFAGIYESWYNQLTGDTIHGFAIVTSPANSVLQRIGHHRCPVILSKSEERLWLEGSASISQITELLHTPSATDMNAYPVSAELKNVRNQRLDLLLPIGERVMPEWGIEIESDIEMFGMGESRSGRKRDNENGQLELF